MVSHPTLKMDLWWHDLVEKVWAVSTLTRGYLCSPKSPLDLWSMFVKYRMLDLLEIDSLRSRENHFNSSALILTTRRKRSLITSSTYHNIHSSILAHRKTLKLTCIINSLPRGIFVIVHNIYCTLAQKCPFRILFMHILITLGKIY